MWPFKKKEREQILEEVRASKVFLVKTTDTDYMFYLVDGTFYTRKLVSKDSRYGLVTRLDGKEKYSQRDLDLGKQVHYIHPRLAKEENAGKIKAIEVKS
jgi:hypothetical protein